MKMEYFRFWIALFIHHFDLWLLVQTGDIFSLLGSSNGDYCLTNSSSAMYYTSGDGVHEETRLLPKSSYFCNFERTGGNNKCLNDFKSQTGQWDIVNSLNYENYPILDMRWEGLSVKELYFKKNPRRIRLAFTKMLDIENAENFKITISLRASEVHLLFCDSTEVDEASCYWFILQGWRGTKTVLRKCRKQITIDDEKYPGPPCSDQIITVLHPEDYSTYLTMDTWGHVVLEKQGRKFFLRNIIDGKTETIFEHEEKEELYDIKYMLGHTKNKVAYYKIHMHDYLRTSFASESKITVVNESPITVKDHKICLSIMITTCRDCWIHVLAYSNILKNLGSHGINVIAEKELEPSHELWTEHKIEFTNIERDIYYLSIGFRTTSNNSDPSSQYWAIDNYRQCSDKEYRVSVKQTSLTSCHLISSAQDLTWGIFNSSTQSGKCDSWKEFGESCIPCDASDGIYLCQKQKICELVSGNRRCFCSPGYTGSSCDKPCKAGIYGYECSKQCGNCLGNAACKVENGDCPICEPTFEGPSCIKPKVDIILKKPPLIIESHPNSCTVQLVNKEYFGDPELNYYLVQYQKVTASKSLNIAPGSEKWADYDRVMEIGDDLPKEVDGLESSTKYRIRILIANEYNKIRNLQHSKVPYAICNTTCNQWKEEDINVTPGNSSVHINIVLPKDRCSPASYNWTIKGEDGTDILSGISTEEFSVGPIAIFKPFKIVFSGLSEIVKEFQTTESVPSEVHEIVQGTLSENKIQLSWQEPREPNGIIQYYKVEYKKIRGKYCTQETWEEKKERNVSTESIELTDLKPFSVYLVTIYAGNQKYESKDVSREAETSGLDMFAQDEDFTQVELNIAATYERSATLGLNNLKCQNVQGPLQITYKYNCTSEWCEQLAEKSGDISPLIREFSITELQSFSNYSCCISFCRNSNCKTIIHGYFQTKASYPNNLRQLLVTSKGKNYIYLRWLSPYPPTGTLKNYRIITTCTTCYSAYRSQMNFEPQKCTIWPDFKCVKLTQNIFEGHTISVQIQATNQEIGTYVDVYKYFQVEVREKASQPPFGLTTRWHTDNILDLFWNHPNETNGNLKRFKIQTKVDDGSLNTYDYDVDEAKYKMTYHVQLEQKFPPSSDIYVEVYAENAYRSSPATRRDSSFPATPLLVDPHISVPNYTKSTITISMNVLLKNETKKNANYLFILVTDINTKTKDENVLKLENILNTTIDQETNFRMAAEINKNDLKESQFTFVLGENNKNNQSVFLNTEIRNIPLLEGRYYNITIFLLSDYKKKYKFISFSIGHSTQGVPQVTTEPSPREGGTMEPTGGGGIYALLLLLLLVPVIIGAIIYRKRIARAKPAASVQKIINAATRNQGQSRSNNDMLVLESAEPSPIPAVSIMKTKTPLSRKSTNPPNPSEEIYSKPVKVANFEEYVKESIENGELSRQHARFPRGQTQPWKYGSMKVNKSKNRYNNLVAYDHTRVKLEKHPGDEYSDYINASYIHGYNVARAYIATQGPKSSTLVDFWRMIWQENVNHIVMLANVYESGKKKVEKYWPNINEELNFENISVQFVSVETFADFEYNIFHVIRGNEERKVEQLHFTSWPDHGVPLYPQSLVPFLRKILKIPHSTSSPIVVHCSAGVGRTGTILLSDICLRMAAKEGIVDMLNNLQKLREQRSNMVDNVEQYKLAHLIVLESLMGLHTSIPCNDIDEAITKLINEEEYKIQMDYLKETEWQNQAMRNEEDTEGEFIVYPEKNRFRDVVPDNRSRMFLTRYPSDDPSSSYINAVQVDGFRCPGRFIVTQQPMPNTVGDFWRLIVERRTSVIVSLNEVHLNDKTCCQYFPTADNPELRPVDFISLTFGKMVTLQHYDIYSVRVLTNRIEQEKFDVEIISFKKWARNSKLPSSCEEFLSFWEEADTISRGSKTVMVTCYDGLTASGVYVALCFVIEKIKLEQECDVCLAVRNVRYNRKQFVTEESQFIFLYETALRFINGFQSYANFQSQ